MGKPLIGCSAEFGSGFPRESHRALAVGRVIGTLILSRSALLRSCVVSAALLLVSATALSGQAFKVYFGNLHSHTSFSDGSGTPEQAYRHARDHGLDFLAITEHNHKQAESGAGERRDGILIATDPTLYKGPRTDALINAADRLTVQGSQEFSSISSGNHVNVFGVQDVIPATNGAYDELITWLSANRDDENKLAVIQLNHPKLIEGYDPAKHYGRDDFSSLAEWVNKVGAHASLIEVLNGPAMAKDAGNRPNEKMEDYYLEFLNFGFHVGPSADQDNHYLTWGTSTDARTAVLAADLTRSAVMEALRNRRVYATHDKNLRVVTRVNGAVIGSIISALPSAGSVLTVELSIEDEDEPDASYIVDVFSDDSPGGDEAAVVETNTVEGNTPAGQMFSVPGVIFRGSGQYVFVRIRQANEDGDDDFVWTAPVWFEHSSMPQPIVSSLVIQSLLPNPVGDDNANEEVTIKSNALNPITLTGWKLRDQDGYEWALSGTLRAGATKVIKRSGMRMSLNNNGDTISLVDPHGAVVDVLTYTSSTEGIRIVR
jgi:hypothetical protein